MLVVTEVGIIITPFEHNSLRGAETFFLFIYLLAIRKNTVYKLM
jgi:hypothetical protein